MRILVIGDIVGSGGREAVKHWVPLLTRELQLDFCIANGENMAAGNGFSKSVLQELDHSGVQVFTGGDHIWDQKEFAQDIQAFPNLVRPANVAPEQPGRGYGIFSAANGIQVGVISLLGRTFMGASSDCPFRTAQQLVQKIRQTTPIIIVDFHAEATSDKIALGLFLDGQVTAVLGTHTHVPTADEQILPQSTAFQSDIGMVGARFSVLGRDPQAVIRRYLTGMPARFNVVNDHVRLHATVVECTPDGRAVSISRVVRDMD